MALDVVPMFSTMNNFQKNNNNSGCLMTLALPTGSGKTYTVIQYVSKQVAHSTERFFFIANQNKSLNENEFKSAIKHEWMVRHESRSKAEFEQFYIHKVAVLRSLKKSVEEITRVPLPGELQQDKKVNDTWNALSETYEVVEQHDQSDGKMGIQDFSSLKPAYLEFQAAVRHMLATKVNVSEPLILSDKDKIRKYVNDKQTPLTDFVNRHFPMIDLKNRQLITVVAAKFIQSYISFWGANSISVSSSDVLGNATLIFDEIDGFKPILLNKIIEDSLKIPLDFQPFFWQIYAGVNDVQKTRSAEIMSILRKDHALKILKERTNALASKYDLLKDYKTEDVKDTTNFIFNLDKVQLTSSESLWAKRDKQDKGIKITPKKPMKEDDIGLYGMVEEVNRFIKKFVQQVVTWAHSYQEHVNQQRSEIDNYYNLADAVRTICDTLRFPAEAKKIVLQEVEALSNMGGRVIKSSHVGHYGQSLQAHGMQLFSLVDSDAHLNRTEISAAFIYVTPEQFLLKLTQKNRVLGLSATADLETVISNFDFKYLGEQLGDSLMRGINLIPAETKSELNLNARYRDRGGCVQIVDVDPKMDEYEDQRMMRSLILRYKSDFKVTESNSDAVNKLEILVSQYMITIKRKQRNHGNDYQYFQRRYVELFGAFICFLADDRQWVALGLQSVLPKQDSAVNSYRMSETFINQVFDLLVTIICHDEEPTPQLKIIAKHDHKESIENQVQQSLKLRSTKGTRVFLLSSYKTLGVSVNLVRSITETEQKIIINVAPDNVDSTDARFNKVDINAIYLGPITHLFTLIPEFAEKEKMSQYMRGYYEDMELVDADEIIPLDVKEYSRKRSLGIPAQQFRQTISYVGAHTQSVLQAVGRLDRTFNKAETTTVMVGDDILNYYNVESMEDFQLGPIAKALQQYQLQEDYHIITANSINRERWQNNTMQSQRYFSNVARVLQENQKSAQLYQHAREYYLKFPTLEENPHAEKVAYAYLNMRRNCYYVDRLQPNDGGEAFHFLEDGHGNECVSEEQSGLTTVLAYPGMKTHFEAQEWATEWKTQNYILNPAQFDNYRGILGEVAARFIIEDQWHFKLHELSGELTELFDYQGKNQILVDVKNWNQPHDHDVKDERIWALKKLDRVCEVTNKSDWKVLIVNLIEPDSMLTFGTQLLNNQRIMEVPYLIDRQGQFALNAIDKQKVEDFLDGR